MRIKSLSLCIVGYSLASIGFVSLSHGGKAIVAECHKIKKNGNTNCVAAAQSAPKKSVVTHTDGKGGVWAFKDCGFFSVGSIFGSVQVHEQQEGWYNGKDSPTKLGLSILNSVENIFEQGFESGKYGTKPEIFFEIFIGKQEAEGKFVQYLKKLRKSGKPYTSDSSYGIKSPGSKNCKIFYSQGGISAQFHLETLQGSVTSAPVKDLSTNDDGIVYTVKLKAEAEGALTQEEFKKIFAMLAGLEKEAKESDAK